jgi:hypothetical protein
LLFAVKTRWQSPNWCNPAWSSTTARKTFNQSA